MPSPEPDQPKPSAVARLWAHKDVAIAVLAIAAIVTHLVFRWGTDATESLTRLPLLIGLIVGGTPLVLELLVKAFKREFGSDLLAGMSIVTALLLDEMLAGVFVVLMLSGGEALEGYAVQRASGVLRALAKRVPSVAHVRRNGRTVDAPIDEVTVGDRVVIHPHEIVPVDGTVVEGHAVMDESFLTGEPYMMSKAPGSPVISGAINGQSAVTIEATALAKDSRYAKIMAVMEESAQRRPKMRRLGDQLGAWYTPLAVAIAIGAWIVGDDPVRFLAVLVVATPCPLLIAIPTAIIGSISLAAKRGIIVKDPATLETIDTCRTIIFDKTGTLTYGTPTLTEILPAKGVSSDRVLALVAALERYSKHPLAGAIVRKAERESLPHHEPREIAEPRGAGLRGVVDGVEVLVTDRRRTLESQPDAPLPELAAGLECVVLLDGRYAATFRLRDEPRADSRAFIEHLTSKHQFDRVMLVSGDRTSEAEYLAEKVGIPIVLGEQTPEQKVEIVRAESERARTCFVGDGINDAPALTLATVGIAFGQASDITAEAAGVVVLDNTLERVDEFFHISRRLRRIALQSAVGGMILSIVGMLIAAAGYLPPVAGAITQEVIDVFAVANALRVAFPPKSLTDIEE